jgi:hypothetical protein
VFSAVVCDFSHPVSFHQDLANEKRVVDAECETKEERQQAYERLKLNWPLSGKRKHFFNATLTFHHPQT